MLKPTTERIVAIDAFRGFALAGIVLVHMVEQYVAGPVPEWVAERAGSGILNNVVNVFLFIFIRGKFFALFSILFGLSFFIQMERGAAKGIAFSGIFLWRLVLLFLIGYAHHLFYKGDILTIYALVGLVLPLVFRISDRVLYYLVLLIFLGIGRYVVFAWHGDAPLFLDPSLADERTATYFETIQSGSLWEVFQLNASVGMLEKLEFQFGVYSRAYLTFGFFLIGMWLGRIHFFERLVELKPRLKRVLWWSLAGFLVSLALVALLFSQTQGSTETWLGMVAFTVYDLNNLAMTILLLVAFCLIYLRPGGRRFFERLAPYGRMALTNYFLQSVIGTFILFGWGLGLIARLDNIVLLGIGVAIIIVQSRWSRWWLKRFYFGPLEWLWRCATYRSWQGILRR